MGRQCEQARDLAFAREYALTLHFGRVRGQHRRHHRGREPLDHLLAADARFFGAQQRSGETAFARSCACAFPGCRRMLIFGDVDQMQEVAERADDVQRIVDGKAVERLFQPGAGNRHLRVVLVPRFAAPEIDGGTADVFDFLQRAGTGLLAYHLAQQAPEQAAVGAQALLEFVDGTGREGNGCAHGRSLHARTEPDPCPLAGSPMGAKDFPRTAPPGSALNLCVGWAGCTKARGRRRAFAAHAWQRDAVA